jgi:hypothetical protein
MTSFVDFSPQTTASGPAFQFQPTLSDGNQYLVTVTWNAFGQRYYINVSDLSGTLIVSEGLAPSGPEYQASFTWDDTTNTATVTTNTPHNIPLASIANARASQTSGQFDGSYAALSTGPTTMTFTLTTAPTAPLPVNGVWDFPLNLLAGYASAVLYFHAETQQFEF